MSLPHVSIFGGGIAGCTVAHLLCKEYKVHLFESSNQLGGFAKTFRNEDGVSQEHSPRIVLNDYFLLERIFKDLGIEDNLISDPQDTVIPLDKKPYSITDITKILELTFKEIVLILFYIIKGFLSSDDQLNHLDLLPVYNIIQSNSGRDWFNTISLVAGEKPSEMPMYKFVRMVESNFYNFYRKSKTINGPWSEILFNNWEKYLKQNNVTIHYNSPLEQFDPSMNYAIVNVNGSSRFLNSDIFVVASDISNAVKIFDKTKNKELKQLKQNLKQLKQKTKSHQMGMQISFPNKIKTNLRDYFTLKSDWNLIVHMQETSWKENMKGSLWSVNIPEMTLYSKRIGKMAKDCSKEEIKQEVLYQLSLKFDLPINPKVYIWPTWFKDPHDQQWTTTEPYFWNATNTKHLRPKQHIMDNLYLAGAYTDTNYYFYYMEGAVESGFLIAEKILGKDFKLPQRRHPLLLRHGLILLTLFSLGFFL